MSLRPCVCTYNGEVSDAGEWLVVGSRCDLALVLGLVIKRRVDDLQVVLARALVADHAITRTTGDLPRETYTPPRKYGYFTQHIG